MAGTDKQKQSLYFPEETVRELMREANRLDRSLSWTMQQAWRIAREEIRKLPSAAIREAARGAARAGGREQPAASFERGDLDMSRASAEVREFLRGKFDHEMTR